MPGLQDAKSHGSEAIAVLQSKQLNSLAMPDHCEFDSNRDADLNSRLDRCILLSQQLLKEAERALKEPRMPSLLAQEACRVERQSVAMTDATVGAILISNDKTGKAAVDLLRMRGGKTAPKAS